MLSAPVYGEHVIYQVSLMKRTQDLGCSQSLLIRFSVP